MKEQLKRVILCTSFFIAVGTGFAQAGFQSAPSAKDTHETSTSRELRETVQFCHSKSLVGASVSDTQGEKLGDIDDILFNPKNGEIFAAIGIGHDDYALVPAQALTVTPGTGSRKAEVRLNTTKDALKSGPTISNDDWQKLDAPNFTQSIYSHYKLQAPSAMGGPSPGSLGGVSSGAVINKPTKGQP